MGMVDGFHGTSCMDGECGWFGGVLGMQMHFVDSSCSNQLRTSSWSDHPGQHMSS
jgi:hypothetical protein